MKKILSFLLLFAVNIVLGQHVIQPGTPQGYWNLLGNATTTGNTLGTTNAVDLLIKTNNTTRFRIGSAGTFSFNNYPVNFGTGGTVLYSTSGWGISGNSISSYTNFAGTTNNTSFHIKTNTGGGIKSDFKVDSTGAVTILQDSNYYSPTLTLKSYNSNNSYLSLVGPNISGVLLKNYYTGKEWNIINQTYGGGIGLDGFGIGLSQNPSTCFLQLGPRGEFKTESYYANNLIIGLDCDTSAHLGIGAVPQANSLRVACIHRGSTTARGAYIEGTLGSGVTTAYHGMEVFTTFSNTAFTNATYNGVLVSLPSLPHASNAITTMAHYNTGTGVSAKITTAYGYRSQITAGTNRWGIYADGTATNYFGGAVGIGTVTPIAGYSLDVRGNTYASGNGTTVGTYSVGGALTGLSAVFSGNIQSTAGTLFVSNAQINNIIPVSSTHLILATRPSSGADIIFNATGSTPTESGRFPTAGGFSVTGNATVTAGAKITTTLTVGNTNTLTGGSSGTIAVISDNIFQITFVSEQSNPADATDYWLGTADHTYNAFGATYGRYRLPVDCEVTNWTITNLNVTSNGTTENTTFALRKNDATDNVLTSTFTYEGTKDVSGTNTTTYAAGDLVNIKITTPTWVTNPVGVKTAVTVWFKRRS